MSTGHNRGIPSVPGSFSDPRPAGPLMVMVITGPNCEQWNYEISKFAATVLASTRVLRLFLSDCTKAAYARLARKELIWFNDRHLGPYSYSTFIDKRAFKHIFYVTYTVCLKAHLSIKSEI